MFNFVQVSVNRRNLTFTSSPDGLEVEDPGGEFEVTVTNNSREFASFQIALTTAGVDSTAIADWYKVEPEICAKKPPGASTTFQVRVVRSPLAVYDTTIDVLLRVFSIEQRSLTTTQKLSLTLKKPQQPLNLVLPNKAFRVFPGDRVDIPVLVYNYSLKAIDITLSCVGLSPTWLSQNEQKIRVEPSYPKKATFSCRLPDDPGLRQIVPFTIEAVPDLKGKGHIPTESGTLEVMPAGVIEFHCTPKKQRIPAKDLAAYQIEFKNASNCLQRVQLEVSDDDRKAGDFLIPDAVILTPGQNSEPLLLIARKKRDWCLRQRLQFDVKAAILDTPNGQSLPIRAVPTHHRLELDILPIVSPFLFLGGGILALLLFWLNGIFNPAAKHTATVRSVRFDGTASNVFSGSSDRSIRQWQVSDPLLEQPQLKDKGQIGQDQKRGVRVIRLKPENNNEMAVGLENGTIQFWDVLKNKPLKTILLGNDRVFDLDFTRDSKYLFSGHGSSRVRQWDLNQNLEQPVEIRTLTTNFAITSLVASPTSSESFVVIAGQFNQLIVWNWEKSSINVISNTAENAADFKPIVGQRDYIESLAIASDILVTADNQGYITSWNWRNLSNCRPISNQSRIAEVTTRRKVLVQACEMEKLDRWTNKEEKPIRSVAITPQGDYLASAGDDGRVNLWSLKNGKRLQESPKHLGQFSGRVHSVDIKKEAEFILVASDAPGQQVKLYREPINPNANQQ